MTQAETGFLVGMFTSQGITMTINAHNIIDIVFGWGLIILGFGIAIRGFR
jgi:hypothetical protein